MVTLTGAMCLHIVLLGGSAGIAALELGKVASNFFRKSSKSEYLALALVAKTQSNLKVVEPLSDCHLASLSGNQSCQTSK